MDNYGISVTELTKMVVKTDELNIKTLLACDLHNHSNYK